MCLYSGQLDKFQLCLVVAGAADHGRIIGIGRQNLSHLFKDQFQLINLLNHHILKFCNLIVLFLHDLVYIEPVSLIGRNTPCGSVGLNDISHLFQI